MSEPLSPTVLGGSAPAAGDAASATSAKPAVQPPVLAPTPDSAPKLFGGHKGGGKKRMDGLVAGSEAAIKVDKEKHAARMREKRAEERAARTPPVLSRPVASPASPAAPLAVPVGAVRVPVDFTSDAPAVAPGAFPMFVAWSQKKLEKAANLIIKIGERVEGYFAAKKVASLKLEPHREKKVLEQFKLDDAAAADLKLALSEAATIELNKRRVGGAEHAHWVDVGLCLVEVVSLKVKNWEMLHQMILEDRAEKAKAAESAQAEPKKK